ncbi:hypothetical protein PoB_003221200 [Plakobranchus ocellatus]|uniref:Uncharacterized protein n=1 Tax=Plakobranchus ocellatus TaxID=259542 RepID=A0AAV4AEP6_9GAST|nr:hypothetical protein PoB_003221200 [Plakobranchus ocellatus]
MPCYKDAKRWQKDASIKSAGAWLAQMSNEMYRVLRRWGIDAVITLSRFGANTLKTANAKVSLFFQRLSVGVDKNVTHLGIEGLQKNLPRGFHHKLSLASGSHRKLTQRFPHRLNPASGSHEKLIGRLRRRVNSTSGSHEKLTQRFNHRLSLASGSLEKLTQMFSSMTKLGLSF